MYLIVAICLAVLYNFIFVIKPIVKVSLALINTISQIFIIYTLYTFVVQYFPELKHDIDIIENLKTKIIEWIK